MEIILYYCHFYSSEEATSSDVSHCYEELFKREFAAVPETDTAVSEDNTVTSSEGWYSTEA